ncbi:MAG: hypothetical protein QMD04_10640 [Anaerolineales bacterium]|nr:hypothetical protein [Anaerolineales bacterium]
MATKRGTPPIKHSRIKVFEFIVAYKRANDGNSPSMREIMEACGITTLSLMDYILADLVDRGLILRSGSRSIRVIGGQWDYAGEDL